MWDLPAVNSFLPLIVVGLVSGSVYSLAALGLVLTYKTSGIFNFAHGIVAALGAFAFYELRDRHGMPWPIAFVLCVVVVGPMLGVILERLTRGLAGAPTATKIVATLGVLVGVQQLLIIRYGAATLAFPGFLPARRVRIASVNVEVGQLIVMAAVLGAAVGLSLFFRLSRLGRAMRGVVDDPSLLALTGTDPVVVRRWAWCIGAAFASASGVLLATSVGLDAAVLTLLVVQAFGAAAVGLFTSLPLTYAGGLAVGIGAALSTKYVGSISWLSGLPASLPFVVLFTVLIAAPKRRLVQVAPERARRVTATRQLGAGTKRAGLAVAAVVIVLIPAVVDTKLITYTQAFVYVIVFLSLALLERTSGQISLAHLGFAAVGASTFSRLTTAGTPWLVAVLVSALVAVPVGALVAIPAIRLSGLHLALATFGFGLLLERLVFQTSLMFGGGDSVPAPRPSIAQGDVAYYYVVVAFVAAAITLVVVVHRSRLGRFLRAMADAPVALATYGTSVTAVKVAVFCISAFLAGLAGALLGPVVGRAAPQSFGAFPSLLLVVVLALQGRAGEYRAAFGAAIALTIIPAYVTNDSLLEWFPVMFGVGAIAVALLEGRDESAGVGGRLEAVAARRIGRSPVAARLAEAGAR